MDAGDNPAVDTVSISVDTTGDTVSVAVDMAGDGVSVAVDTVSISVDTAGDMVSVLVDTTDDAVSVAVDIVSVLVDTADDAVSVSVDTPPRRSFHMPALPDRFTSKFTVDPETGCWIWTAGKTANGYGKFYLDGRHQLAHRVAYAAVNGPIPDGMVIDHTCNVRACVNPAHLHAVSQAENVRYAIERDGTHQGARTHCPRGHALTSDNLVAASLASGKRTCLTCHRARNRERSALQHAVASALGKAWGIRTNDARRDPRVLAIVRNAWTWKPANDQEAEELAKLVDAVERIESGRRLTKKQKIAAVYTPPA